MPSEHPHPPDLLHHKVHANHFGLGEAQQHVHALLRTASVSFITVYPVCWPGDSVLIRRTTLSLFAQIRQLLQPAWQGGGGAWPGGGAVAGERWIKEEGLTQIRQSQGLMRLTAGAECGQWSHGGEGGRWGGGRGAMRSLPPPPSFLTAWPVPHASPFPHLVDEHHQLLRYLIRLVKGNATPENTEVVRA